MAVYKQTSEQVYEVQKQNVPQSKPQPKIVADPKVPWWQVYIMACVFLVILFIIPFVITEVIASKTIEAAAVIVFYGTLLRWVIRNEAGLNQEFYDDRRDRNARR